MAKEKLITVEFTKERETKNTVRFMESEVPDQPPVIGTLYIQKWAIGDAEILSVTIKVG